MSIDELDFQLNFFYFINTDDIIKNLKSDDTYKHFKKNRNNLLEVFHLLFSMIMEATQPYTKFILSSNPSGSTSLFGEMPGNSEVHTLFFLCDAALFHHCIIQGYKNSLTEYIIHTGDKNCSKPLLNLGSNSPIVKISATTMPTIIKGCVHSFLNKEKYSPPYGSDAHQKFNGQSKRTLSKEMDYSVKLIHHLKKESENTTNKGLFVSKTESTPIAFLFNNTAVRGFNTVLNHKEISSNSLLEKYRLLYNAYSEERSNLLDFDKVLFDIILEQAYGFSLFNFIYELFYNMENEETFKKIASLRSDVFYKIISNYLASLPITYNRSILLKYACTAISNSPNLVSLYSKDPEIMGIYETFTQKPKINFAAEALQTMNSFFRLLNYSVLPLIENLWFVLTNRLGIGFEDHLKFIKNYYSIMTYDYTTLSPAIFFEKEYPASFRDYYDTLYTFIQENKEQPSANILFPMGNDANSSEHALGNIYKYDFCSTLKQQCTIINSSFRKDIVYHLLEPLQYRKDNYYDEQQKFINNHAKNIYTFAQTLDWSVLSENNDRKSTNNNDVS